MNIQYHLVQDTAVYLDLLELPFLLVNAIEMNTIYMFLTFCFVVVDNLKQTL